MKLTKLISLLLALLMMTSMLFACATTPDEQSDQSDDTPDQTTSPDDEKTPEEEEKPFDIREALEAMPKSTFAGDEFLIAASSTYEGRFTIHQFPIADQITGSLVQDALFNRDAMIEEVFGITLAYNDIYDSGIYYKVSNSIRSGDNTYSLILSTLASTAIPLFENGLLYDLNQVEHIDLTRPWWNKNSVDSFEINGKIYMATGAITNRYVYTPYAMLFNQKLIDETSLDNPYVLVENDEWTLEVFTEMLEDTYRDLNANDVIDLEDFYGLAPASDSETAWYFAAGGRFLDKNSKGEFEFTFMEENCTNILEDVIHMYATDDVLKYQQTYDSITAFREGRAIFHSLALADISMLDAMQDAYGIVPMPKYDQYQENYYSNSTRFFSTMALLPSSLTDIENVGLIVEAMAMTSKYTSLDKQYEQVLLNRQALDAQSKAALITIADSATYDLCYLFDFSGMPLGLRDIINHNGNYASYYALYQRSLETELEEFLLHYE